MLCKQVELNKNMRKTRMSEGACKDGLDKVWDRFSKLTTIILLPLFLLPSQSSSSLISCWSLLQSSSTCVVHPLRFSCCSWCWCCPTALLLHSLVPSPFSCRRHKQLLNLKMCWRCPPREEDYKLWGLSDPKYANNSSICTGVRSSVSFRNTDWSVRKRSVCTCRLPRPLESCIHLRSVENMIYARLHLRHQHGLAKPSSISSTFSVAHVSPVGH